MGPNLSPASGGRGRQLRHSLGGIDDPAASAAAGIKERIGCDLNIEKGTISVFQFSFLIIGFIEGSILLTSYVSNIVKNSSWLVLLSGLASIAPFVYIYALLAQRFPGINFAQINQNVFGTYLGTAFSSLYIGYFLLLFSFNLREIGNFYTIFFMRETPFEVFLIVFIFVCAFAVWNGLEVLARINTFLLVAINLSIMIATLMLLPKMNLTNLLPLAELPLKDFIHGTQIIADIPFGEIAVFLTMAFALNDNRHVVKSTFLSLILGAAIFLIITIRNTAVLGNTEALLYSPSFEVIRLINIGFLSRIDILFAFGFTIGLFLKCSILFYGVVLLLSQLLKLRTYRCLIFPLGCITTVLAIIVFPSITAQFLSGQNEALMMAIPFFHIFPPLTLLVAKLRNLPKKGYR